MITSNRVNEIFMDCLFKEDEDHTNHILVKAIMSDIGFHPQRLESHRKDVEELLDDLPVSFKQSSGGGMSFLNACVDKNGTQWGEHRNMEQLFALGMGLGIVEECAPRKMWSILPGGMPYYVIKDEKIISGENKHV
jgi:hypothetical protein